MGAVELDVRCVDVIEIEREVEGCLRAVLEGDLETGCEGVVELGVFESGLHLLQKGLFVWGFDLKLLGESLDEVDESL